MYFVLLILISLSVINGFSTDCSYNYLQNDACCSLSTGVYLIVDQPCSDPYATCSGPYGFQTQSLVDNLLIVLENNNCWSGQVSYSPGVNVGTLQNKANFTYNLHCCSLCDITYADIPNPICVNTTLSPTTVIPTTIAATSIQTTNLPTTNVATSMMTKTTSFPIATTNVIITPTHQNMIFNNTTSIDSLNLPVFIGVSLTSLTLLTICALVCLFMRKKASVLNIENTTNKVESNILINVGSVHENEPPPYSKTLQ